MRMPQHKRYKRTADLYLVALKIKFQLIGIDLEIKLGDGFWSVEFEVLRFHLLKIFIIERP